ncbi:cryptochrome/photolyase family protein [Amaricoccus solimangrovi]|uniref:Deoxyribodipyrimidine photo-lyase n=1 Tax=Amaricoccus solimangrovi TaxID=2589815 RepID=A0A501WSX2_9RHOB|nr:deoxyribodipyrimidine photo-lyase [Amaricoccus solimangrovi]TPE51465.1 deoxyribodipyrimidine photo-lyase [Amaricoccus solimangrovi]
MTDPRPRLFRFRRDLRLRDNDGLAAAAGGGPVVPVFVLDPETEALGAAAKWRLGRALGELARSLEAAGSRLVSRRGEAGAVLRALARETGAGAVHWSRSYEPEVAARDERIAAALRAEGVAAIAHPGFLLREPWAVETGAGGSYKVFTPFAKAAGAGPVAECAAAPELHAPEKWPRSEDRDAWALGAAMDRGAAVVAGYAAPGEAAALARLDAFLDGPVADYPRDRDRTDRAGTSGLSEHLTWGEIAPRRIWHAAERAGGAAAFRRELLWREFAWHLMWHTPRIAERNWRESWDAFPWRRDNGEAEAWRRGMTGEPMVDAGMREMFVTGRMHNRVRMIVASYLTKNLLTHWTVGLDWFAECLTDWDPASNALNWQWVAGSGPDAAPFFRVFNPRTQAEKFDPEGIYRARWIAGFGDGAPGREARDFFAAAPRAWGLDIADPRPEPIADLGATRARALDAYRATRGG